MVRTGQSSVFSPVEKMRMVLFQSPVSWRALVRLAMLSSRAATIPGGELGSVWGGGGGGGGDYKLEKAGTFWRYHFEF